MTGTDFPTPDNWLQCEECHRFFDESGIAAEDQHYQWCTECHTAWVERRDREVES